MSTFERQKSAIPISSRLGWAKSAPVIGKLTRFGAVGVFNSALYTVLCSVFIDIFGVGPTSSSAIAFATCLPIAYWNQKRVTFRSHAPIARSFVRFTLLQTASFVIAVILMYVCVTELHLHYVVAIVATLLVVPLLSYFVMERWVF